MKIAFDAMGGDYAPDAAIRGAKEALKSYPSVHLAIVGKKDRIIPLLKENGIYPHERVELVNTDDVVLMSDPSTIAIRSKKNSSITVAATEVKEGRAQAVVSAGHTGAAVAATTVRMRLLEGVDRPAIAAIMPSESGPFVLIDAGANIDSKPINLIQFALMGSIYAEAALGVKNPRVGLLSVGEEDVKGNELTKEVFKKLSKMKINFIGNVEGKVIFQKYADVVVCDGFVGNVLLKASESLAKATMRWIKEAFSKNTYRIAGALLAKEAFRELKEIGDYESYGGAPLLGVNGICIIGHGSSSPKAFKNAIRVAAEFVNIKLNDKITTMLHENGASVKDFKLN
ncbi:MAG TPA: phosphate acyltransferase PlsX [Victivallales bacterium]|nr:phosphate acyltransferase PlsX [Victivallales bacterium]HPO90473.1 phosphate acyltransferase PlsX [Victivallales bacterium]HRR28519.1 phosphate acyltransferase PlsX [Victivallales bacterium]HRU02252.1 phosphate acyltransferase PlsX [Victivallales bacterium]